MKKIISSLLVFILILPLLLTGCAKKETTAFKLPDPSSWKDFVFKDKIYTRTEIYSEAVDETVTNADGTSSTTKVQKDVEYKTEYKLAMENSNYELYFNEAMLDIALINKKTSAVWYSNPSAPELKNASGLKSEMSSQMQIFFVNKKTNSQGFKNTFSDCVLMSTPATKQYYLKEVDGKLRVVYILGQVRKEYAIPTILTKVEFDNLIQKMKDDKNDFASRVTSIYLQIDKKVWDGFGDTKKAEYTDIAPNFDEKIKAGETLYIIKDKSNWFKSDLMNKMDEAFKTYFDMTIDKRDEMNAIYGVQAEVPDVFWIPLDYSLDEDGLKVSIKNEDVAYNNNTYEISTIDVLKYFGAGSNKETGYMFIPDGSGALIKFNNKKTHISDPVRVPIYGLDSGRERENQPFMNQQGYLPVFGIKKADSALFAIMESGASAATVVADIAGKNEIPDDKNTVFASFKLVDFQELSFVSTAMTLRTYQEERFSADISIKYTVLAKEKADYSGMAEYYRNYLYNKGVLKQSTLKNEVPFNLELIGGCSERSAYLGVSYNKMHALTTFAQAKDIIGELADKGIKNIAISYKGWANNGLRNTPYNKIKVINDLGGKNGLNNLMKYAQEKGVTIYPEAELIYVYKSALFSGYSSIADASRMLNKKISQNVQYNVVTQKSVSGNISTVVGPTKLKQFAPDLMDSFNDLGIKTVSLGGLSYDLGSNFKIKDFYDRDQVMNVYTDITKQFKDDGFSMMGKGANGYMLNSVDRIFEISNTSSKFILCDESVPFYQMVIHGAIQYSGEATNLNGDSQTVFLQAVEAGAGVYYRWSYAQNDQLKDIHFEGIYSLNYKPWLDEAVGFYTKYNNLLGDTTNQKMVHHDTIADGVVKVTYEKGTVVYVNYNNSDYTAKDIVVPARDFAVIKGGAK